MKTSGIYKITNKINGKYYVGSSNNITGEKGRWSRHKQLLNKNCHHSIKLQRAWNKYKENNFEFVIIEQLPENELLIVEQKYLNDCKEIPNSNYNVCYNAFSPMKGRLHTKKSKEKMSESHVGSKNYMFGKTHSEKSLNKIRLARSKQTITNEHRENIRKSHIKPEIYNFVNIKTNEKFTGTQHEFRIKTKINPYFLLKKLRSINCGWKLIIN